MKTFLKYVALLAVFAVSVKVFVDSFTPEYEAWREKYPPEPDEDENDPKEALDNVVAASELFGNSESAFNQEKGGI